VGSNDWGGFGGIAWNDLTDFYRGLGSCRAAERAASAVEFVPTLYDRSVRHNGARSWHIGETGRGVNVEIGKGHIRMRRFAEAGQDGGAGVEALGRCLSGLA
jgi:hypothetical protein